MTMLGMMKVTTSWYQEKYMLRVENDTPHPVNISSSPKALLAVVAVGDGLRVGAVGVVVGEHVLQHGRR